MKAIMLLLLLPLLALNGPVFAGPALAGATSISGIKAQDANYDGKSIILTGGVAIDHNFGKLYCEKATLTLQSSAVAAGHTFVPARILLEGKVHVELKNGNSLEAQFADINCIDLEGLFTAQEPDKVVYIAFMEGDGDGKKVPVRTSSQSMRVKMKKMEGTEEYTFSELKGEGKVSIEYLPKE